MLADLDKLLAQREIDAVIVPMHEAMHPSFRWLTRGAAVTRAYAIKLRGRDPVLVAYPMERDEAAATGLETRSVHDFDHERIFREAPDPISFYAALYDSMLRSLGAGQSIAFFGNLPVHLYLGIAQALDDRGWRVHRGGDDLIQLARKRKERWEIDAIASVGERTEQVVDEVRRALRERGQSLTLGDLKAIVSREIHARGMAEDHETILSQGRDAGVPHSRGDASARVRASVPIVLDIFPVDCKTGYFFDLTRTFCVGPIPEELRRVHAEVEAAFHLARENMRAGTLASAYQALVCDYFEERGYRTIRSHPTTTDGYVHSLGHGVGLDIHEKPNFTLSAMNQDRIEVGDIVTIEPGLYFPDREIGVRIEDTFVVGEDGRVRTLCRGGYGLAP
ncbi:MAG TPA: Xaa-Pro peptidase family protein [Candidatus Solibacter sp.]|nr:Xaa-Pro peptidase family protein [Candidatus Solibacter sp.]